MRYLYFYDDKTNNSDLNASLTLAKELRLRKMRQQAMRESENTKFDKNGEKIIKLKGGDQVEEESSSDIADVTDDEDEIEKRFPSIIDLEDGDDKIFAGL